MTLAVVALEVLAPAFDLVWLLLTALCVVGGFLVFRWREQRVAPPRPEPADDVERLRSDTPAVVNMLANDATLTAAGLRATIIDLAARGWLRILPPDEDDELARVRPAAHANHGDSSASARAARAPARDRTLHHRPGDPCRGISPSTSRGRGGGGLPGSSPRSTPRRSGHPSVGRLRHRAARLGVRPWRRWPGCSAPRPEVTSP